MCILKEKQGKRDLMCERDSSLFTPVGKHHIFDNGLSVLSTEKVKTILPINKWYSDIHILIA